MPPTHPDLWARADGSVPRYRELLADLPPNRPVLEHNGVRVHQADCLALLRTMPDASVHAIVTDPPYGLADHKPAAVITALTAWANGDRERVPDGKGFMGRAWDAFVPPPAVWDECLRVLKPGGHMLVFAGTRTVDLMGLSIRLAGFEIRDSLTWLYGSGFPKGKGQLKPASEPIIVARKPLVGTVAANVLAHGCGVINVDACRVGDGADKGVWPVTDRADARNSMAGPMKAVETDTTQGRWPPNVVLDEFMASELDEQSGDRPSGGSKHERSIGRQEVFGQYTPGRNIEREPDSSGASRFFPTFRYQAKAPTKERPKVNGKSHPTVKPLALMRWLVRLVTPPGGTVLDPFAGSGTTGEAAALEGFECVLVEAEPEHIPLIVQRLTPSDESTSVDSLDGTV